MATAACAGRSKPCSRDSGQDTASAAADSAGRLAQAHFSRAILALAFTRLNADVASALGAGLALYWRHGDNTRRLARRWLGFSLAGWALLFFVLALANGFIFLSAGVPVVIGVALAAIIAWAVHQAFVAPLALAGVSASPAGRGRGPRARSGPLRKNRAPAYSLTSTVAIAVLPKYCGWYMPWATAGIQVKRPLYMALMK